MTRLALRSIRGIATCADRLLARALPVALLTVIPAASCSRVPSGTRVDDPELEELLRPTDPIADEQLIRGRDGMVYYTAVLRHSPDRRFEMRYIEELEERGFSMHASGSSPHAPVRRVEGYNVRLVREESLEPYTIKYKSAWQGNASDHRLLTSFRDYAFPLRVSRRRITICLSEAFLKPWHTAVVIPEHSLADPPSGFPLPPGAVVMAVTANLGSHSTRWIGERPPRGGNLRVDLIARVPPDDVLLFYKESFSGAIRRLHPVGGDNLHFDLKEPGPAWALGAQTVHVSAQPTLFSGESNVFVSSMRYSFRQVLPGAFGGDWQAKSLKHVPPDAVRYWITLWFD